MKVNLAYANYITLALISVRVTATFVILHLIKSGAPGFELIDRKEINDSIPFVSITALLISSSGWRVNLLISAPLATISCFIATHDTYSVRDENMACYKNPDSMAGRMSLRYVIIMLTMTFAAYMFRKTILQRFIEQELSRK